MKITLCSLLECPWFGHEFDGAWVPGTTTAARTCPSCEHVFTGTWSGHSIKDASMDELTLEQAAEMLGISAQYFRRCHEGLKLHPPFTLEKLAPYLEPRLTGTLPDDVKAKIASLMPPRRPDPQLGRSPAADPAESGAA
jgi:hypothetical protein